MPNRILWNRRPTADDPGSIDEIVVHDPTVHIEQMSDGCWWIGIDLPDGTCWSGNFIADSGLEFAEQESDVVWDEDDCHEENRDD